MTDKELKKLQDKLWGAADILRSGAHLAANKFGQPILGLIFLRYADILYKQHKEEIEKEPSDNFKRKISKRKNFFSLSFRQKSWHKIPRQSPKSYGKRKAPLDLEMYAHTIRQYLHFNPGSFYPYG